MPPLPTTGHASSVNVFRVPANQLIGCNDVTKPVDAFLLFLSHMNINAMITFTNIEGKRQNPGKWIDTDDVEMKAFAGCLLFWGAKKTEHAISKDAVRSTLWRRASTLYNNSKAFHAAFDKSPF